MILSVACLRIFTPIDESETKEEACGEEDKCLRFFSISFPTCASISILAQMDFATERTKRDDVRAQDKKRPFGELFEVLLEHVV